VIGILVLMLGGFGSCGVIDSETCIDYSLMVYAVDRFVLPISICLIDVSINYASPL
jgi:hypothetical protein